MIEAQIVVIAKEPLPGKAKTRLAPAYGPAGAAALALAALKDTLDAAVVQAPLGWCSLSTAGPAAGSARAWSSCPSAPASLGRPPRRRDVLCLPRSGLAGAGHRHGHAPGDARPARHALARLTGTRGRARAGARRRLLVHRPAAARLTSLRQRADVDLHHRSLPSSTRLARLGLPTSVLPSLRDVDLPSDVAIVAAHAPGTRFARLAQQAELPHDRVTPRGVRRRAVARSDATVTCRRGDCATRTAVPLPLDLQSWCDYRAGRRRAARRRRQTRCSTSVAGQAD